MALVDERDIENRIEELEREIQQERIENKSRSALLIGSFSINKSPLQLT